MTQNEPSTSEPDQTQTRSLRELLLRLASAVVLATVTIAAVLASPWSFLALVMVCAGLLLWEWGSATRGNGFDATTLIQSICVIAVVVFVGMRQFDLAAVVLGATALVIVVSAKQQGRTKDQTWLAIGGLFYIALPAIALIWLRSDPDYGLAAVLFLLLVAWTTDTASYVGGRIVGGPKLAPQISPKKPGVASSSERSHHLLSATFLVSILVGRRLLYWVPSPSFLLWPAKPETCSKVL